jgi:hypothetical protein
MVFKTLLIVIVFAVLLEDSASIRKTEEEKKEDREIAERVNKTLAEEKKKEDEERKRGEQKKKEGEVKIQKAREPEEERKDKGEALPCFNLTCPTIEPCPEEKECPTQKEVCPEVEPCSCLPCEECPKAKECGPCPKVKPCPPCGPESRDNSTSQPPSEVICPEPASMTVPEAMAVGAVASLLVTGVAKAIGLLLRYVPPVTSGFVFLATIVIVWYFSSQHPETARELGGRAVAILREASVALGHRLMAAIQRHHDQVNCHSNLKNFV